MSGTVTNDTLDEILPVVESIWKNLDATAGPVMVYTIWPLREVASSVSVAVTVSIFSRTGLPSLTVTS